MAIIIFVKEVTIYFNMLGSFREHWICNNLNTTCVVNLKRRWIYLRKSKFSQKTTKPKYFRTSSKQDTICWL